MPKSFRSNHIGSLTHRLFISGYTEHEGIATRWWTLTQ